MNSFVLWIVLVNLLHPFFLNEVSNHPAVHQLHQECFKIIMGEPEVEVQLGVELSFLGNLLDEEICTHIFDLPSETHFHLLVVIYVILLVLLRQS